MTETGDKTESDADGAQGGAAETADTTAETGRKAGAGAVVAWTLVGVLLVAGAAYVSLPYWRGWLPESVRARIAAPADDRIAALQADLAASGEAAAAAQSAVRDLQAQNEALVDRLQTVTDRLSAIDGVTARLAENETALEDLRASVRSAGDAPAADEALAARVADLEKAVSAGAALGARLSALEARIEAVDGELREANRAALENLAGEVGGVRDRLAAVEEELRKAQSAVASAERGDALGLAIGQLRDALAGPGPFEAELATLRKLAGDDPAIDAAIAPVAPFAADGTPTRAMLFSRLPATVSEAIAASRRSSDQDWVARIGTTLRDFVTVRRIDGRGSGPDAAIARAEMAARQGDLDAAVQELSALDGAAAAAVGPWLGAARARLAADAASRTLNRIVLSGFAGDRP